MRTATLALSLLLVCLVLVSVTAKSKRHGVPSGHREDIYCSACKRLVRHLENERDHFLRTAAVVRGNESQKREKIYNKKQLNIEQIEVIAHLEDKVDSACDATEIYKDKVLKRSCQALLENHDEAAVEALHKNMEDDFCEDIGACTDETPEYLTEEEKEEEEREAKLMRKAELRLGWLEDNNGLVKEIESDQFHKEVMEGSFDTFIFLYRADLEGSDRKRNEAVWSQYTVFASLHQEYRAKAGNSTTESVRFVVMEQVTDLITYDLGITDFTVPVVALFPEKRRNDPVILTYEELPTKENGVLHSMIDALATNGSIEESKRAAESLRHDLKDDKTEL